jgi:hypothetical protein
MSATPQSFSPARGHASPAERPVCCQPTPEVGHAPAPCLRNSDAAVVDLNGDHDPSGPSHRLFTLSVRDLTDELRKVLRENGHDWD